MDVMKDKYKSRLAIWKKSRIGKNIIKADTKYDAHRKRLQKNDTKWKTKYFLYSGVRRISYLFA